MNDDELTALGIKLFIETHKESKNMEEEQKVGLLARDFIKEHIKRENELENIIFELKEKIKSLETCKNVSGNPDVPLGYNIFLNMIKYARVSYNYDHSASLTLDLPTMTIDNYPLMPNEFEYISKIMESDRHPFYETSKIGAAIKDTAKTFSSLSDVITGNHTEYKYGIGGSPKWQDNLADDRAWT